MAKKEGVGNTKDESDQENIKVDSKEDGDIGGSTVNTTGLESNELSRLFEIIDKLRDCGVSEDISLPQLAVFGDQSSGKSSVLEAITGIPFPIANTLCTRFATQINFRRTASQGVVVTIIPAKHSTAGRAEMLKKFVRGVTDLTAQVFCELVAEASEAMGLPKPGEERGVGSGTRFSDDVLKIELSGPKRPHFSVVDVPGLFQCATAYQTDEDVGIVESMVKGYMAEPRTIILAVASAVHETANQKVFRLATEADPTGIRTVGLITKPDAVQQGDEERVIDIASNRVVNLTHGWFVVRNRSTEDVKNNVTLEHRRVNELNFFKTAPWRNLDKGRVGIEALETYLRQMLYRHIRKEYPKLLEELEKRVDDLHKEIKDLGPARGTSEQQRSLLLELANSFELLARDALMGIYRDAPDNDELRLRASIRELNDNFALQLKTKGHLHNFDGKGVEKIYAWILKEHRRSRGIELEGIINYATFMSLFRAQTKGWEKIAREHISSVHKLVRNFVGLLLQDQCSDPEIRVKITTYLYPHISNVLENAHDELRKLLQCERGDFLLTYDDKFLESLEKIRKDRLFGDVDATIAGSSGDYSQGLVKAFTVAGVQKIMGAAYKTRENQTVQEIYDYLNSYYGISRTRFIDCVCLQVIERHFLGPNGSVRAFSPTMVGKMSHEELEAIAGEDFGVTKQRQILMEKLQRLEGGLKIANSGYV